MSRFWPSTRNRTTGRLRSLIEDTLSAEERTQLLSHARTCEVCRLEIAQTAALDRLLREHVPLPGGEVTAACDCPDDETVAGFADGAATAQQRRRWGKHVASCPACLSEIRMLQDTLDLRLPSAGALELLATQAARAVAPQPQRRRTWHPALVVAAAAAVLIAILFVRPGEQGSPGVTPSAPVVAQGPAGEIESPIAPPQPTAIEPTITAPGTDAARQGQPSSARPARTPRARVRQHKVMLARAPGRNALPQSDQALTGPQLPLAKMPGSNPMPTDISLPSLSTLSGQLEAILASEPPTVTGSNALPADYRALLHSGRDLELLLNSNPLPDLPEILKSGTGTQIPLEKRE